MDISYLTSTFQAFNKYGEEFCNSVEQNYLEQFYHMKLHDQHPRVKYIIALINHHLGYKTIDLFHAEMYYYFYLYKGHLCANVEPNKLMLYMNCYDNNINMEVILIKNVIQLSIDRKNLPA